MSFLFWVAKIQRPVRLSNNFTFGCDLFWCYVNCRNSIPMHLPCFTTDLYLRSSSNWRCCSRVHQMTSFCQLGFWNAHLLIQLGYSLSPSGRGKLKNTSEMNELDTYKKLWKSERLTLCNKKVRAFWKISFWWGGGIEFLNTLYMPNGAGELIW